MPEFIIHIGPHKTGSTYLQAKLRALAPFLAAQGVLYPADQGELGHMMISRKLATPDRHAELAAQFAAYAAAGAAKVVLTAEDLSPLDPAEIAALRAMLGGHPVRIVFYCRGWTAVTVSNWGEQIRHGFAVPLDQALEQRIGRPRQYPPINYGIVLGRYAEAFGKAALTLVSLDGLADAGLDTVAHFLSAILGIAEPAPDTPTIQRARNVALPLLDAEIIRALNAMNVERRQRRDAEMRRQFIRRRDRLALSATRQAAGRHTASFTSDETGPKLARLHDELFATYGASLVGPHPPGRFFVPALRQVPYVRRDYLDEPGVRDELETVFARFTASPGPGRTPAARKTP